MRGLWLRILIGCTIFAALAIVDVRRNGTKATRFREYGVLAAALVVSLIYGAINDQVTVTISPEYFHYGAQVLDVDLIGNEVGRHDPAI